MADTLVQPSTQGDDDIDPRRQGQSSASAMPSMGGGASAGGSGGGRSGGGITAVGGIGGKTLGDDEAFGSTHGGAPGGGRALNATALGAAEKNGDDAARDNLYKRAGLNENDAGVGGGFLKGKLTGFSRRKKLLASGGVSGIVGVLIALTLIAPIYRIPAIMSDAEAKVGAEVDHVIERRVERMIVEYLIKAAGGTAASSNFVITGSPLSDVFNTLRSRHFEAKLLKKTGLSMEQGPNGVTRLISNGQDLGNVRNYEDVAKLVAKGTVETKREFYLLARTTVGIFRASGEAKLLKLRFLKNSKFGTPKEEKNKPTQAENEKATTEDLTRQQLVEGTAGEIETISEGITCVTTADAAACDPFKQDAPDAPVPDPASEAAKGAPKAAREVVSDINEANDKAVEAAVKDRQGGYASRMLENILTKVLPGAIATTVAKALSWILWIDLLATIQHLERNFFANDLLHRIPIMLKEATYGAIAAQWMGYGSQVSAGRMGLHQDSVLTQQMGNTNPSQPYKYLFNNGMMTGGVEVNPKVGSDTFSLYDHYMDLFYNNIYSKIAIFGPLELWYQTIGRVIRLAGDGVINLVAYLSAISGFTALAGQALKSIFGDNWKAELGKFAVNAILNIFGIIIDPLATGVQWFNNVFTGLAVAFNYVCRTQMGCMVLTQSQGVLISMQLQQEQDQQMAWTPLKDRLFDTSMPNSVAGAFMRAAPINPKPGTVISSLFGMAAKLPASISAAFTPRTRAAPYDNLSTLSGVQWMGGSDQQWSAEIPSQLRQQKGPATCPKTDPTKDVNVCQADETAMESLKCYVDSTCDELQQ